MRSGTSAGDSNALERHRPAENLHGKAVAANANEAAEDDLPNPQPAPRVQPEHP